MVETLNKANKKHPQCLFCQFNISSSVMCSEQVHAWEIEPPGRRREEVCVGVEA